MTARAARAGRPRHTRPRATARRNRPRSVQATSLRSNRNNIAAYGPRCALRNKSAGAFEAAPGARPVVCLGSLELTSGPPAWVRRGKAPWLGLVRTNELGPPSPERHHGPAGRSAPC